MQILERIAEDLAERFDVERANISHPEDEHVEWHGRAEDIELVNEWEPNQEETSIWSEICLIEFGSAARLTLLRSVWDDHPLDMIVSGERSLVRDTDVQNCLRNCETVTAPSTSATVRPAVFPTDLLPHWEQVWFRVTGLRGIVELAAMIDSKRRTPS